MNTPETAPEKFLFDTAFDAPRTPPPIPQAEVEKMRQSHLEELEQVRQQALQQGLEQGRQEAQESLDRQLAEALEQLIQEKELTHKEMEARLYEARSSCVQLAMTIAQKLAGTVLARTPQDHIEQFFRDSLALLPDRATLRLHLAPALVEPLQSRLENVLKRNGQENSLVIVPDETIRGASLKLLWADGGIEHDPDRLFATIKQMVETRFSEKPGMTANHGGENA